MEDHSEFGVDGGGEEISESHHYSLNYEFSHSSEKLCHVLDVWHISVRGGAKSVVSMCPARVPMEPQCLYGLRWQFHRWLTQNYLCMDGAFLYNL